MKQGKAMMATFVGITIYFFFYVCLGSRLTRNKIRHNIFVFTFLFSLRRETSWTKTTEYVSRGAIFLGLHNNRLLSCLSTFHAWPLFILFIQQNSLMSRATSSLFFSNLSWTLTLTKKKRREVIIYKYHELPNRHFTQRFGFFVSAEAEEGKDIEEEMTEIGWQRMDDKDWITEDPKSSSFKLNNERHVVLLMKFADHLLTCIAFFPLNPSRFLWFWFCNNNILSTTMKRRNVCWGESLSLLFVKRRRKKKRWVLLYFFPCIVSVMLHLNFTCCLEG